MFFNKRLRENDKLILGDSATDEQTDASVINVKADTRDRLFSAYSYSGDKLNSEFSEYVFDKAKSAPIGKELTINIHTTEDIDGAEVEQTLKSHYRAQYAAAKKEVKRLAVVSAIMTVLGVIALTVLILLEHFFDNFYVTTIAEIAAWVFIWEAVDYFFLQRHVAKADCILIQRIFLAKVEIHKTPKAAAVAPDTAYAIDAESEL